MVGTSQLSKGRYWVYGGLAIAYLCASIGFLFLADLTQWIVQAPRSWHLGVFDIRHQLMFVGIAAFLTAMTSNYRFRVLSAKRIGWNVIAFVMLFVGGFLLVSYIMFIPKQTGSQFISIAEAKQHIRRSDEVMVVENNGDARAFPNKWMRQPHIVGDSIGGEDIVMTYCSLSHLAQAYSPVVDGRNVNLKVFTQLQNNLVMYDVETDEPIQQIYGSTEYSEKTMRDYPTQMMSFEAFQEIYPEGTVFYNPGIGARDFITRMMLRTVVNWQHELDAPVFPTIDVDAPGTRELHPKEQVWGIKVGASAVAYTYDYFRSNNWVLQERIGEQDIVLVYFPEYETVGGFDRKLNGETVAIGGLQDIDIHGNTSSGKLRRISVSSEVFWMVWSAFYPDSELRKALE